MYFYFLIKFILVIECYFYEDKLKKTILENFSKKMWVKQEKN